MTKVRVEERQLRAKNRKGTPLSIYLPSIIEGYSRVSSSCKVIVRLLFLPRRDTSELSPSVSVASLCIREAAMHTASHMIR